MSDPFALTEAPIVVPAGLPAPDPAALLREQIARRGQLQNAIEQEQRAADERHSALLSGLLEVADALERILAGADAGVAVAERQIRNLRSTHRLLLRQLERAGVTPLVMEGQPFDPALADAEAFVVRPDLPDETVLRELVRAYRLGDRTLRRAKVVVSQASE